MKYTFTYEANSFGNHSFTITETTSHDMIDGIVDNFVSYLRGIGYCEETIAGALREASTDV